MIHNWSKPWIAEKLIYTTEAPNPFYKYDSQTFYPCAFPFSIAKRLHSLALHALKREPQFENTQQFFTF
jgi:hypothetical protein